MPLKARGERRLAEIDRHDDGVGWFAYPDETLQRAGHALVGDDGGVWVFEPLDAPGIDDLLAEYGDVAGVVVGNRLHERDAVAVADRHDVAVHVPEWVPAIDDDAPVRVERVGGELADSGIRPVRVRDSRFPPWNEAAFIHESSGTVVVPEALGTAPHFRLGDERLAVHPLWRLVPPRRAFAGIEPQRLLVGHGEGIHEDVDAALRTALRTARTRLPALYLQNLRLFVPGRSIR